MFTKMRALELPADALADGAAELLEALGVASLPPAKKPKMDNSAPASRLGTLSPSILARRAVAIVSALKLPLRMCMASRASRRGTLSVSEMFARREETNWELAAAKKASDGGRRIVSSLEGSLRAAVRLT